MITDMPPCVMAMVVAMRGHPDIRDMTVIAPELEMSRISIMPLSAGD